MAVTVDTFELIFCKLSYKKFPMRENLGYNLSFEIIEKKKHKLVERL